PPVSAVNCLAVLIQSGVMIRPALTQLTRILSLMSVANEHAASKRFGTPEELANVFVFLSSERGSYCIGSTYFVDGGMLKTI
ncbi:SDR family oxidoreductase, partial [Rhizobium leguminosarum]|uniref:SDR family oxidoreductase n=1 Tax=Rhizobium leguminosarum TaxID=384 RepID=UPI003F9621A9